MLSERWPRSGISSHLVLATLHPCLRGPTSEGLRPRDHSVTSCPQAALLFNASRAGTNTREKFGRSRERGYLDDRDQPGYWDAPGMPRAARCRKWASTSVRHPCRFRLFGVFCSQFSAIMKDVPAFLQQSQSSGPGQAAIWHRLEELYTKKWALRVDGRERALGAPERSDSQRNICCQGSESRLPAFQKLTGCDRLCLLYSLN